MPRCTRSLLLAGAILSHKASAVYLPGAQPNEYGPGQDVPLYVNKIWSPKTQLPYPYYSLPFCEPSGGVQTQSENIGQILVGDRIQSTDYKIAFGKDTRCAVLCERTYGAAEVAAFQDKIDSGYVVTWVLDQLPGAVRMFDRENPDEEHYSRGCELGLTLDSSGGGKQRLLFNHFLFTLSYHQEDGKEEVDPTDPAAASNGVQYRIVGFEVEPYSVKHAKADTSKAGWDDNLKTCSSSSPVTHELEPQTIDNPDTQVLFTYDVTWKKGSRKWADRWDLYLAGSTGDQIHWWSVGNSLMIALFMAGVIAAVLVTVLNRDISRYNAESGAAASKEDLAEETGWKLVHGDVFRPPAGFFGPMFLSVFVGGGVQVLAMSVLVLTLALLGFLSPANQGSEVTAFVLLFVFMGIAAGYTSSSVYKMFKGKAWKRNVFLTSFSLSGGLLTATAIINAAVWSVQSSMAISIKSFLLLLALWLVICVPLVAVGSYLGIKGSETKFPVRVNNIPRQIPPQPWYLQPALAIALGGVLPFGAVFVELHFVMSSLWLAQLNFVYKFLALVLLILVITCAEISIVMTYFQLCAEDYNWWWRSFLTPGVSGLYVFLYSAVYFSTRLEITNTVSSIVYFGYMAVISWGFFLLAGSVGFLSTLWFNMRIYGSIKVD